MVRPRLAPHPGARGAALPPGVPVDRDPPQPSQESRQRVRLPLRRSPRRWREDHRNHRPARRARPAGHPLHRGGRDRAGHLGRDPARRRRGGGQRVRWGAPDRMDGGLRGGEGQRGGGRMAAAGDPGRADRVPGRDQGAADDAGGRGHPLAQRDAAPGARPLLLHPAGALDPGGSVAGAGAGPGGHGHLPREHGGRVRWNRVGVGDGGGRPGARFPERPHGRFHSRGERDRDQAGQSLRHEAARGRRNSPCDRPGARVGDADAQGQHHEVHGGGRSGTGATRSRPSSSRTPPSPSRGSGRGRRRMGEW